MAKAVSNSKDKGVGKGAKGAKSSRGSRVAAARQAAAARRSRGRAPAKGKGKGKAVEKKPRGSFLRDVRAEMSKVSWPTRKDLVQSTIVVLAAVAIAAAFTFVLDTVFSRFVDVIVKAIS